MSAKLLVVLRPLGLGDALVTVPAYKALARAFPDHLRVFAGPSALAGLVPLFDSFDAFVPALPHRALPPEVHGADVVVNLHGKGPDSHGILLQLDPKRLIAFEHPDVPQSTGMPPWDDAEHERLRWCRLLEESGIPTQPGDLAIRKPDFSVPRIARGATIVHPGAKALSRQWPLEHFSEVIAFERRLGREVIVTGSASEIGIAQKLARMSGLPLSNVFAGRTGVHELAGLVAACGRLISGDTGIAHLATAYGTPSVLLFGPVRPDRWGPPADRPMHRVIWTGKAGDPHANVPDPGLLEITPGRVIGNLMELELLGQAS